MNVDENTDWSAFDGRPPFEFLHQLWTPGHELPVEFWDSYAKLCLMSSREHFVVDDHPYRIHALDGWNEKKYPLSLNGKFIRIFSDLEKWLKVDQLSSYISGKVRTMSRVKEYKYDQWTLWHEHAGILVEDAYRYRGNPVTRESMHTSMRYISRQAGPFRTTVARCIYKYFSAKNVLDTSSGWGERMIGAASIPGLRYTGVDPNTKLVSCYHRFYSNLPPDQMKDERIKMICSPIQSAGKALEHRGPFDIVFTSPPFFDREIYSDESTQSISGTSTVDEWLQSFMFPMIDICNTLMAPAGYFVISINDYAYHMKPRHRYCEKILDYMCNNGFKYLGCLPFSGFRKSLKKHHKQGTPQPCWVLKRVKR